MKTNTKFVVFEPIFLAANTGESATTCQLNEIMCVSDGRCIEAYKYCNGIIDCSDASDEELCSGFCNSQIYSSFRRPVRFHLKHYIICDWHPSK